MSEILETQPQYVKDNLKSLSQHLSQEIPSKRVDENILIATWNIRTFGNLTRKWKSVKGNSPKRDLRVFLA